MAEEEIKATETMEDLKDELEASLKQIKRGDVMTGTVVDVSETACTVDLKYYAPGIISKEDMSSDPNFNIVESVKVGDTITATVLNKDDGAGNIKLSAKEATDKAMWEKFAQMMADKTRMTVTVDSAVKGGLVANVSGVRGFIPASRAAAGYVENLESFAGQELEVIVITAEPEKKRLVLSAREAAREKEAQAKLEKAQSLAVGSVVEGRVETVKPYGVFVDLGDGISGLVHISQMSIKRIKTPNEVCKAGDTVKAKVIGNENGRLSLSMKALVEVTETEEKPERPARAPRADRADRADKGEREYKDKGEASTGLGSLLKGIKLN